MRTIRASLGVVMLLGLACGGDLASDGSGAPTIANPVARDVSSAGGPDLSDLSAGGLGPRALLGISDAAMVRQTGDVMVVTVSRAGDKRSSRQPIEDLRPSTTTARADGGYAIGRRDLPEAISRSEDVRVLGVGEVDGVEAWVIWYTFRYLTFEGVITVWRTEWIDMDSLRLLRQFEQDDDGFAPFDSIDRHFSYDR